MFLPPTPSVLSFSPELCADVKDLRVFKYISTLPFCFVFFKRKKKKTARENSHSDAITPQSLSQTPFLSSD